MEVVFKGMDDSVRISQLVEKTWGKQTLFFFLDFRGFSMCEFELGQIF